MISSKIFSIFKSGSRTYFYSSLFFPKEVRDDVFILYSFVRLADNFVDAQPQQTQEFLAFRREFEHACKTKRSSHEVIQKFVHLMQKRKFEKKWVIAFLDAMEQDLTKSQYFHIQETEKYMYGSAEVIGLMMAKILRLPTESYGYAQSLGKAMQFVNFIRDIEEDIQLRRTYFPKTDLQKYGLKTLSQSEALSKPKKFQVFIHDQLQRYRSWQADAEKGYQYIPARYLIPIKTAADMYLWTANQIEKNPQIVFTKKVKPTTQYILSTIAKNSFTLLSSNQKIFSTWLKK